MEKVSKTYKNITGLDVLRNIALIQGGKIVEYH
ncbi:hypothetical protein KIH39_14015 [Telmatocola sphagniphila]|uniref:Uncharacterized protein n=1 Tax=Telmatocola sphagniphila TaxID=1123043 RepID=A0A8E6EWC3_9BACT|nr:hypothetical protein KIH39_14015 [Telmatocola sphagniphila]